MAKRLDRTRPYGTVTGGEKGSYEQDGVVFDGAGNEIVGSVDKSAAEVTEALGLEAALAKIADEYDITPEMIQRQFKELEERVLEAEARAEDLANEKFSLEDELKEARARIEDLEASFEKARLEEQAADEDETPEGEDDSKAVPELIDLDLSGKISKSEIIVALETAGIPHDKNDNKDVLLALAKSHAGQA